MNGKEQENKKLFGGYIETPTLDGSNIREEALRRLLAREDEANEAGETRRRKQTGDEKQFVKK